MQEINKHCYIQRGRILNKLDKLSTESAEQIRALVTKINNLKLKVKDRTGKVNNFCTYCNKESRDMQECWFKDRHNNENSVHSRNTSQSTRGVSQHTNKTQ